MSNNFPSIGEIRLSPSDKYYENGIAKFDQLLCDGSVVLESEHPVYWELLVNEITSEEVQTLTASNAGASDYFGSSCSLYGDKLVVGAPFEDTIWSNSGIVYIYEYNESTSLYEEVQTLTAEGLGSVFFGSSCSLYGDILTIGAPEDNTGGDGSGLVYIYEYNESTSLYEEVQTLTASNAGASDNFGSSCSLYGDKLVVGAPFEDTVASNSGMVYIYTLVSGKTTPLLSGGSTLLPYVVIADLTEDV